MNDPNFSMLKSFERLNLTIFSSRPKINQQLSLVLRNYGIFAATYKKPASLIEHFNLRPCDIVIIDLHSALDCIEFLNEHPRVLKQEIIIAFYCDETETLRVEDLSLKFKPLSVLNHSEALSSQIHHLLYWVMSLTKNRYQLTAAKRELGLLKSRYQTHLTDTQDLHHLSSLQEECSSLVESLSLTHSQDKETFLLRFSELLDSWERIENYSFYELGLGGQSLVEVSMPSIKNKKLPLLRLGKECAGGIGKFAQEMAYQVAFEELGEHAVSLKISGADQDPDILVFLKLDSESFETAMSYKKQWQSFEGLLTNAYREIILTGLDVEIESQFIPIWDALTLLDQEQSDENTLRFLSLDLSSLNHYVAHRPKLEFLWKSFFNEFLIKLSKGLDSKSKVSTYGTTQVLMMIPVKDTKKVHFFLKDFIQCFEYWKFFKDRDLVLPRHIYPKVYLIPGNSSFFLKKVMTKVETKKDLKINAQPNLS